MVEISLNKAIKNYGFNNILDDFNLEVMTGEKVALIGSNGSGKTTVFKIVSGEENLTSGNVSIRRDATIGVLLQTTPMYFENRTVKEVLLFNQNKILELEKRIKQLETEMENCDNENFNTVLNEYSRLQERFTNVGGYDLEFKLNKICSIFKISEDVLHRNFSTLSGGEKTIVNLASIVLGDFSVLLLDEPTNHLDIDTIEWLEEYLNNFKGTVLISSHDRYFLDKVVSKVVLIENGKSEIFFGNYTYFLEENERRINNEFEAYKDQQKKIEAMKASIKKLQDFGKLAFPGGEPFFRRAASIQKRLDKIELLNKPSSNNVLPIVFELEKRSGKDVLTFKNLNLQVGENLLLSNVNFSIKYKDKICLIGKNGSGKTSVIKLILNEESNATTDEIIIGSNINIGYMPQEIRFNDSKQDILDFARMNFVGTETQLRASLAKFLFYGEDVHKRIEKLSGGEKVRLKLFDLIQQKPNFIVLDEPTNHIDIATREVLEEALINYEGTVLFVSHDRYFINKVADKILAIENKTIKQYEGNYDYYREKNKK